MEKKPFENPPFEIVECKRHFWKEEIGSDIVFFDLTIKTERFSTYIPLPFDELQRYCKTHRPEIGKYYSSVRKNIMGLGPKHSKMLEIMDEEDFDHLPHIHACIDHLLDLEKRHQDEQKMKAQVPQFNEAAKKVRTLSSHFFDMKQTGQRNEAFMDHLMEHLNNEALTRFPEIFNSDPQLITEFQSNIINWVRTIGEGMDKLSHRATTEHKES